MPRNIAPRSKAPARPLATQKWTPAELLAVRNFGPAIIGEEKHAAAQAYIASTNGGLFGPALISRDPKYLQTAPVKIVDGKPVFAHELEAAE